MDVEIQTVLSQNITIVFDSLDLTSIDSGQLKRLRSDVAQPPVVMDTPEMIVSIFPPEPLIIQMGERRIRLTLQGDYDVGSIPLWDFANKCVKLIPKSRLKIVSFGFNFDVSIIFSDGAVPTFLARRFLCNPAQIEQTLKGDLKSFSPRFRYASDGTLYDLILEPLNNQHIKAHVNVHFENQSRLPSAAKLRASYLQEFRRFMDGVSQLLEA